MRAEGVIRNRSTYFTPIRDMDRIYGWLNVVVNDNKVEVCKRLVSLAFERPKISGFRMSTSFKI